MHDPIRQLVADALGRSRVTERRSVSARQHLTERLGREQAALGAEALRLARLAAAMHAGMAPTADGRTPSASVEASR